MFTLQHLDHVALRVSDLEVSARWYEKVLRLHRHTEPEWGPFPIMMLAGSTGLALFPAKTNQPSTLPKGDWLVPTHFAFKVRPAEFDAVLAHYEELGIDYWLEDHNSILSVFTRDPDGHQVEVLKEQKG